MQVKRIQKGVGGRVPRRSASRTATASASASRQCCAGLVRVLDPKLFKALADPTRIQVLMCLTGSCGPRTVTQVADCCSVDLSVVSRHLGMLRDAGVLEMQKVGREAQYTVNYAAICRTLRQLADALEACCPGQP